MAQEDVFKKIVNLFLLQDIVAALKDIVTKEQAVSNIVMCSFVTVSSKLCSSVLHKRGCVKMQINNLTTFNL